MKFPVLVLCVLGLSTLPRPAYAASEAECAIWICLPGGFPSGCAAAYSAFKNRIKYARPPLPDLASCVTGPEGGRSTGRYEMGEERFYPCKYGFELDEAKYRMSGQGWCVPTKKVCVYSSNKTDCQSYLARRRSQTRYIKMWVDGKYLGKFFYR